VARKPGEGKGGGGEGNRVLETVCGPTTARRSKRGEEGRGVLPPLFLFKKREGKKEKEKKGEGGGPGHPVSLFLNPSFFRTENRGRKTLSST